MYFEHCLLSVSVFLEASSYAQLFGECQSVIIRMVMWRKRVSVSRRFAYEHNIVLRIAIFY